tara:strand:+ start:400 stop:588 length:189 start_codon:yes stop_codon:yes gene_type:complete
MRRGRKRRRHDDDGVITLLFFFFFLNAQNARAKVRLLLRLCVLFLEKRMKKNSRAAATFLFR